MQYFRKEDFAKIAKAFEGRKLTLETQKEIFEFMQKEKIYMDIIPGINKKTIEILSKMKQTSIDYEKMPNWCATLPDGSQVVWNRRHQRFYLLESIGVTTCDYYDWLKLFPSVVMSEDLEWLLDNMTNWQFEHKMEVLLGCFKGKFDMLKNYLEF